MKEFIPEQHELKQLIRGMQDYLNSDYTEYCGYEMSRKDVDIALTYLKDIPIVKPSMCELNENFATCGICEKVITVEYSFCPFCGTCIDWDREDGF